MYGLILTTYQHWTIIGESWNGILMFYWKTPHQFINIIEQRAFQEGRNSSKINCELLTISVKQIIILQLRAPFTFTRPLYTHNTIVNSLNMQINWQTELHMCPEELTLLTAFASSFKFLIYFTFTFVLTSNAMQLATSLARARY